jgi:mevalonate kinase
MTFGKIVHASAPAKVMLFGEHFVVYGAPAILGSIDKRVRATARYINSEEINVNSDMGFFASYSLKMLEDPGLNYSESQSFLYPLYVAIYDILNNHFIDNGRNRGVEIGISSDVPWGAGLGSSAASCVATVAAVGSLFLKPEKEWVYSRALRAEKIIHENTSGADCHISTFGGLVYYLRNTQNKRISFMNGLSLMVVNTGVKHSTKAQVSLVKNFRIQNRLLFDDMATRSTRICNEAVSAIKGGDKMKLGELMNENHTLLKELGVSNDKIDDLVRFCLDNGASGAKLTGAGGGGSIVALIPNECKTDFIARIGKKNSGQCIPIRIVSRGLLTD